MLFGNMILVENVVLLLNLIEHMCVNNSCTLIVVHFFSMDMNSQIGVIRVNDILA